MLGRIKIECLHLMCSECLQVMCVPSVPVLWQMLHLGNILSYNNLSCQPPGKQRASGIMMYSFIITPLFMRER